jgi:hypothetical protein
MILTLLNKEKLRQRFLRKWGYLNPSLSNRVNRELSYSEKPVYPAFLLIPQAI